MLTVFFLYLHYYMHKRNDMRDMPVVSSQYWNIVYGQTPGQASLDEEGM